jgi:hypothetical protein
VLNCFIYLFKRNTGLNNMHPTSADVTHLPFRRKFRSSKYFK